MSIATSWEWGPGVGRADILTDEDCVLLLDADLDDDLLKAFPTVANKLASNIPTCDEALLYPSSPDASAALPPLSPPEVKPPREQLAAQVLRQFDQECKQENLFSQGWLEEKVDLGMFDGIPAAPVAVPAPPPVLLPAQPLPTDKLLEEFETVYGAVELTHLTPPQSPPGPASQLLLSYAQQATAPPTWPEYDQTLTNTFQDVQELIQPGSSSPSTASSSPRSSTDDEWSLPSSASSSRGKPYSRGSDDRRSRKKEQNKNAATRYRQKKKAEIEVLLGEESSLRQRHTELGSKCSDLQREIRYLKGLMRDLFKAKGLIK